MIKLTLFTKKEGKEFQIEEVIDNVYDFEFDPNVGKLIIKYLDIEENAILKVISLSEIKRIKGQESGILRK